MPRSHCPHCSHTLAWYDLVPVASWIQLRGSCRYCSHAISALYPFIEALTALLCVLVYLSPITPLFYGAYFCLFSALIVSIRTDLEYMLISRFFSLCMIPVGLLLTALQLLPITLTQSTLGALAGYGILWLAATLFRAATGKDGLGEGDFELLAMIGSFTGPIGVWFSLLCGSLVGSVLIALYLWITQKGPNTRVPFGPFLALGAFIYILYSQLFFTLCMY